MLIISSCKTPLPLMQLEHYPQPIVMNYHSRGEINVLKFEDKRHHEEKAGDKLVKSPDGTYIWSKQTSPSLDVFLMHVIETEIQNSGLFTIADAGEYTMSGEIKSMKISHKDGSGKAIGTVFSVVGIFIPIAWVPAIIAIAANKDDATSLVFYNVLLKKGSEIIWQDEIYLQKTEKYPTGFKNARRVSRESSVIFDNSITVTVKDMIKRMNEAL